MTLRRAVTITSVTVAVFLVAIFLVASLFSPKKKSADARLQIVTSIYPWGYLAERIGGANARVITLTPPGAEPHDYEPTSQDIIQSKAAQIFIYNGSGVDTWAMKVIQDIPEARIIQMSSDIQLLPQSSDSDESSPTDPHIWLDPNIVKEKVPQLVSVFSQIDPTHAAEYQMRGDDFMRELEALDQEFRVQLSTCSIRTLVTSHAAFAYLVHQYGLEQVGISGLSPEEEPSAKRLRDVAEFVRQNHVTTIFFESLVSPKTAETIASETGAQTAVLNPVEGLTSAEMIAGETYFTLMRKNLQALQQALQCS